MNLLGLLHEQAPEVFADTDISLGKEHFHILVERLVDSVDMLPWIWLGAEGMDGIDLATH